MENKVLFYNHGCDWPGMDIDILRANLTGTSGVVFWWKYSTRIMLTFTAVIQSSFPVAWYNYK